VSVAGYRGGQVSQGENHLTEYMPGPMADLLGVSVGVEAPLNSPYGGPGTLYGARIQPIFAGHCVTCHGRNKHKGNLRLDSFEAALHGGKHGVVIKGGDPKSSELLRRITLTPSDADFMPAERRPLSESEIKLIAQWISTGASGTMPSDAVSSSSTPRVSEVTFPDAEPAAVARQRVEIAAAVAQFQQRFPNVLDYQSRDSAELVLNAAWMQSKFGDNDLSALSALTDHIVSADFSNTSITDKSAAAIGAMKRLRILRLVHTHITDATLQSFGSLQELETLSLFDTQVTPRALPVLAHLSRLQHVYVGATKVSASDRVPAEVAHKLVF
jgi:Planctomycete cytochrome C